VKGKKDERISLVGGEPKIEHEREKGLLKRSTHAEKGKSWEERVPRACVKCEDDKMSGQSSLLVVLRPIRV
jgi:hypothetical protein